MSDGSSKPPPSSVAAFHFLAGLTSGIFTAVLLQPADLLKTRIQQASSEHVARIPGQPGPLVSTLRAIFNSPHPIQNLWRGTVPSAIRTGCGSALYFGGLNTLRSNIARREKLLSAYNPDGTIQANSSSALPKLSGTANLITGAVARAGAGFAMMPITVIKVRYESSLYSYRSLWGAVRDIATKEGLKGFFAGFGATAVRDAPYAGLYVLFYEGSKKYLGSLVHITPANTAGDAQEKETLRMKSSTSAGINFVSGTTAAVLATSVTNPFDAIKTRLQLMPNKYGNMVKAAKMMLRHEGVRSMFDGLALRMGRKAISSALAWTIYEELIRKAEVRWKEGALL